MQSTAIACVMGLALVFAGPGVGQRALIPDTIEPNWPDRPDTAQYRSIESELWVSVASIEAGLADAPTGVLAAKKRDGSGCTVYQGGWAYEGPTPNTAGEAVREAMALVLGRVTATAGGFSGGAHGVLVRLAVDEWLRAPSAFAPIFGRGSRHGAEARSDFSVVAEPAVYIFLEGLPVTVGDTALCADEPARRTPQVADRMLAFAFNVVLDVGDAEPLWLQWGAAVFETHGGAVHRTAPLHAVEEYRSNEFDDLLQQTRLSYPLRGS